MTIQQIENFNRISKALFDAVESGDEQAISRLNAQVEEAWHELIELSPSGKDEQYALIEFFLSYIKGGDVSSEMDRQCKEKILRLARSLMA